MNVKGGTKMNEEELVAAGSNLSMVHSDFMFGSEDMQVEGTQKDGTKVAIFKDGNFVI
jgi:aminopeptidase